MNSSSSGSHAGGPDGDHSQVGDPDANRASSDRADAERDTSGGLGEVAWLFLKLGLIVFGGPAVHIAMMEEEFVTRRKWISRQHFLDLIGATNLIPGPNSTEMTMHVGYERARWPGPASSDRPSSSRAASGGSMSPTEGRMIGVASLTVPVAWRRRGIRRRRDRAPSGARPRRSALAYASGGSRRG